MECHEGLRVRSNEFCCSGRSGLQVGNGGEQGLPVREDDVCRDGAQVLEESVPVTAGGDGGAPGEDTEIGGGVEGEGEQVEADQEVGQGLLAVAEAVLEVVSPGLEDVEGLVLDLPSGTGARGQVGDAVRSDRQVGDEGVVVGALARAAEDFDREPVDGDGIGGAAQWDLGEPAIDAGGLPAALDDGPPVLLEVDAGEVFGDGLVRVRLAGQDEAASALPDGLDHRLAGVEVVAQVDGPEAGDAGAVAGQPALGGGALAVLLLRPVLGGDELWWGLCMKNTENAAKPMSAMV